MLDNLLKSIETIRQSVEDKIECCKPEYIDSRLVDDFYNGLIEEFNNEWVSSLKADIDRKGAILNTPDPMPYEFNSDV